MGAVVGGPSVCSSSSDSFPDIFDFSADEMGIPLRFQADASRQQIDAIFGPLFGRVGLPPVFFFGFDGHLKFVRQKTAAYTPPIFPLCRSLDIGDTRNSFISRGADDHASVLVEPDA